MTIEEIRQMETGRELDALVWLEVFKKPCTKELIYYDAEHINGIPVSLFSTDITAAWLVVEKMRADNYTLQLQVNGIGNLAAFFLGGLKDERILFITEPHVTTAICKAALIAVCGDKKRE